MFGDAFNKSCGCPRGLCDCSSEVAPQKTIKQLKENISSIIDDIYDRSANGELSKEIDLLNKKIKILTIENNSLKKEVGILKKIKNKRENSLSCEKDVTILRKILINFLNKKQLKMYLELDDAEFLKNIKKIIVMR